MNYSLIRILFALVIGLVLVLDVYKRQDEYISNKKAYATIIKSGWDLGSGFDQYSAYNLPV